jgi:hypothetical protein
LSRSSLRYQSIKKRSIPYEQLEGYAKQNPVEGFWKCYHRIRNAGTVVNHKKLHSYISRWAYHFVVSKETTSCKNKRTISDTSWFYPNLEY